MVFLLFAGLALLGGVLYPPSYYDAMAYRLPRVLHWLADERWHWIHTEFNRLNTRGCGFEWVAAPVLALTRTDRFLFLTSFIPFCLLPGLLFSSFTRMGVKRRVAYYWMWVLPLGSCCLLQAGTLGNDLFATGFALAAFDLGLRARQTGRIRMVWLSLLAAGIATGVKATTIPLLLVFVVVLAPCWRLMLTRAAATLAVGVLALGCSFVPTAFLNYKNCGDWKGGVAEKFQYESHRPWVRLVTNAGLVVLAHLNPPVAPFAEYWNDRIAPHLVPQTFRQAIGHEYRNDGVVFTLVELQTDDHGLGLELAALLLVSALAAVRAGRKLPGPKPGGIGWARVLVFAAIGVAFLAFIWISFDKSTVRLLCPYYLLLVIPLLLPAGHALIVRRRSWRLGVIAVAVLSSVPLVVVPDRPLIPVQTLIATLHHLGWGTRFVARAERVYSVYGRHANVFAEALQALPPDTAVLGLISYDDPEAALWKPYGTRRIVHVCQGDSPAQLRAQGVRYVLAGERGFPDVFTITFADWLAEMDAEVVKTIPLSIKAREKAFPWHLVKLRSPP